MSNALTAPSSASVATAPHRYRAFVSYSHRDARAAAWWHRSLESYRVPSRLRGSEGEHGILPDRLSPIFRDREDLASAGELGPRIQVALADSDALIVICSPEAARSSWVNEEILAFKRLGRAQRIVALIVDGEPHAGDARECFPLALRFDLDQDGQPLGPACEPLAADIRAGKDGKALARLKLISGLLGVSLDTLRQREAARRHRRLLAVTALAVLVMLVTSFLAVQAVLAQRSAERRQKQAEALVDFMLGDLNDKLAEVSRLDILEAVDDKAMDYFQSLPITDVTDQSLVQRAKALEKIGSVRLEQGHLPQAMAAYQAAADLSGPLASAEPANIERQLAHANTLTFIGMSHWTRGDLNQAQFSFTSAQDLLQRARAFAPTDTQLLLQLATLSNNTGHVMEARGDLTGATMQYRSMLADCQKLVGIDANRAEWQGRLGLAHNNLAKMSLLNGDLTAAVAGYRADVAIESALAKVKPMDNSQAETRLFAQAALGRTLVLAGDLAGGIAELRGAVAEAKRLRVVEPDSTSFQEDFALYSYQLASALRLQGNSAEAESLVAQSITMLLTMTRKEGGNVSWIRELAEARIEQSQLSRAAGRSDDARAQVQAALLALEPMLAAQPLDRALVLATTEAQLVLADVTPDPNQARTLRRAALATLAAQTSGMADPRLQELRRRAQPIPVVGQR